MNGIHYIPFVQAAGGGGGVLTIFDERATVGTIPPTTLPDPPKAARTSLLALLTVSGEETFESYTAFAQPGVDFGTITLNGITATITPTDGTIGDIYDAEDEGRYNTTPVSPTGTKHWNYVPSGSVARLTFSAPIAAFWTYITDIGDFGGKLEIKFQITGGSTITYNPTSSLTASNGTLYFWGLVDDRGTTTYDWVELKLITNTSDFVGFDGMGWATAAQIA